MNKSTGHARRLLTERIERIRVSIEYASEGVDRRRAELKEAEQHLANLQMEEADLGYSLSLLDE